MNIIAFILFVAAAVVFLIGEPIRSRFRLATGTSLGLAILTIGFIVQFCADEHTVTF